MKQLCATERRYVASICNQTGGDFRIRSDVVNDQHLHDEDEGAATTRRHSTVTDSPFDSVQRLCCNAVSREDDLQDVVWLASIRSEGSWQLAPAR